MAYKLSEQDKTEIVERFIRYCKIDTQSAHDSEKVPSTQKQFDLARLLKEELKQIGIESEISDNCFVYATIPANSPEKLHLGFLSHQDTSPDAPATDVKPMIHENITGEDIKLPGGVTIESKDLIEYKGQSIITSDGSTLLGADDKAGVAGIMQAATILQREKIKHGTISICFTPDEEVGEGIREIDLKKFTPKIAFTLDGGKVGGIECESFNAKSCEINIKGKEMHPGYAYGLLVNAARIAGDFISKLPKDLTPEKTKDREGFIHICSTEGNVGSAKISLILRDFEEEGITKEENIINGIIEELQQAYPASTIQATYKQQYRNMWVELKKYPELMEAALAATRAIGVEPLVTPIRGGSDGSQLSFMGIPTANVFAGGLNFHSRTEFVPIPSLYKVAEVVVQLATSFISPPN